MVTLIADRVGLTESLYLSTFLFAVFIACLIPAAQSGQLVPVLIVLFCIYVPGELAIVVNIVKVESFGKPELRTALIGIDFQAMAIGRAISAKLGEYFYFSYGFEVVGLMVCGCFLTNIGLYLCWSLRECSFTSIHVCRMEANHHQTWCC